MYYSNALNSPFINNFFKNYNTNYYINKQGINNPNDPRNFKASANIPSISYDSLPDDLLFPTVIKDPSGGYNTGTSTFTIPETGVYSFGTTLKIRLINTNLSTSYRFTVNINFIKNGSTTVYSQQVYDRANAKLSLSQMTFSHQLIRLIFIEQLYRAFTILKGEPYHND
jgi:hypothetical protein